MPNDSTSARHDGVSSAQFFAARSFQVVLLHPAGISHAGIHPAEMKAAAQHPCRLRFGSARLQSATQLRCATVRRPFAFICWPRSATRVLMPCTTPARSSAPARVFASRFRGHRSMPRLRSWLQPGHGHACSCRVTAPHVLSFSRAMGNARERFSLVLNDPGSSALALFRRFVAAGPSFGGREWLVLGRVVNASLAV